MHYAWKELKKAASMQLGTKEDRVAVLGNCSTQLFATALQGQARLCGINVLVYDAEYDQIDVQLIDPLSEVYCFQPDEILLWISSQRLYEEFMVLPVTEKSGYADKVLQRLRYYWDLIAGNCGARVLQMNFTEIQDKPLGQFSCKVEETFTYQIRKLNASLQEAMAADRNIYPVDLLSVQVRIGQEQFFHAPFYYSAKMPVSLDGISYMAEAAAGVLTAMHGHMKKCIITDLDNTLWGGIVGDDGIGGIEIGELGRGHAFTNLQRWLKQLKEYGVILAVCSKNEEKAAREPFEKHREMVLRLDDFSVFVADWKDKAANICLIQETLNIGMDAIVFLDDSPFERGLVRQAIPALEVPELPEDPALCLEYLQYCNYFEAISYASADGNRTGMYQAEFARRQSQTSYGSLDGYLQSLGMEGRVQPFSSDNFARVAQLTQRSNQFNLRTVRYTQEEIARIAKSSQYLTLAFSLKDKYGDYGLVAVAILEKKSVTEVFIDTWLMSCRVFKRGMEEFVMNCMVRIVRQHGFLLINAQYLPTAKNVPVKDIYTKMGFTEIQENWYCLKTNDYQQQKNFIKEVRNDEEDRSF